MNFQLIEIIGDYLKSPLCRIYCKAVKEKRLLS